MGCKGARVDISDAASGAAVARLRAVTRSSSKPDSKVEVAAVAFIPAAAGRWAVLEQLLMTQGPLALVLIMHDCAGWTRLDSILLQPEDEIVLYLAGCFWCSASASITVLSGLELAFDVYQHSNLNQLTCVSTAVVSARHRGATGHLNHCAQRHRLLLLAQLLCALQRSHVKRCCGVADGRSLVV